MFARTQAQLRGNIGSKCNWCKLYCLVIMNIFIINIIIIISSFTIKISITIIIIIIIIIVVVTVIIIIIIEVFDCTLVHCCQLPALLRLRFFKFSSYFAFIRILCKHNFVEVFLVLITCFFLFHNNLWLLYLIVVSEISFCLGGGGTV